MGIDIFHLLAAGQNIDFSPLPSVPADQAHLEIIKNIAFSVIASVDLLVLVISGLRYVMSNGDPNALGRTKNSLVYSAIGLIVTISAFAIVTWLLNNI